MCIILAAAVYNLLINEVRVKKGVIDAKFEAIGNIDLGVVSVEFSGNDLKITVENKGQQDISGFIVRVTSSSGEVRTEDNVTIAGKEKPKPLEIRYILVIPTPFGAKKENYNLIEVFPKFEYNNKEEIAETASFAVSGEKISASEEGSGGDNSPIITECSDGIDNDGDGLIDLYDSDCVNSEDNDEGTISCNPNTGENIVLNSGVETDSNNDNIPDNWDKYAPDSTHILSGVYDSKKNSRVLKSEFLGGSPNSFGWQQTLTLKPNQWYELSIDYATENIEPNINSTTQEIIRNSNWAGISVVFYSKPNWAWADLITTSGIFYQGPEMTDFDESVNLYRTYKTRTDNWKTYKKYFKTPSKTVSSLIKTYNYPKGKIYFDNFVIKEIPENCNPDAPAFKKSGTLRIINFKGKSFFPIISYGIPQRGGQQISYSEIKENGFNAVIADSYRNLPVSGIQQELLSNNLVGILTVPTLSYYGGSKSEWKNDPEHKVNYQGWSIVKTRAAAWKNFENLFAFNGPDESQSDTETLGAYIPNFRLFENMKNYYHQESPSSYLIKNYGSDVPNTELYSNMVDYYYPNDDILSFTWNTPISYPTDKFDALMNRAGERVRRALDLTAKRGMNQPLLAFGLGVYWWADWDGKRMLNGEEWHYNQYIPFNLQRFQIWDQIINGATGVWFWGTYHSDLDDVYYQHHWNQISIMSKELSSLNPVLLEPDFYDEWQVSDSRIEIMMKKHAGKIYLFTASTHYEDLRNVKITLSKKYTLAKVTAINEVSDENLILSNRTITTISSDKHSFTDNFIGEHDSVKRLEAPGYAVHTYEIEYS